MPETGSSNYGNSKNVRIAAGWVFFQEHGKNIAIPLGYTQGGIQTEISTETEGIEADQSSTAIVNVLSNTTCTVTTPLMEWTKENMLLAFPGAQLRTDAQGKSYVAMTASAQAKTGTLRIHPTDMPDNDHSKDTFYTNVTPSPNLSFTMDGTAAQVLPIEWQAAPGNLPYAEQDGDTAYYDYMPTSAIISVTGVTMAPTTLALTVGQVSQLTATIAPVYATDKQVLWESSNAEKASVSASGSVFAVAAGSATITAKSRDGNKTATCAVTVSA